MVAKIKQIQIDGTSFAWPTIQKTEEAIFFGNESEVLFVPGEASPFNPLYPTLKVGFRIRVGISYKIKINSILVDLK